jgi:hypothetical protein
MNSEQEVMALEAANAEGFEPKLMTNPNLILAFMLAGDATITFKNAKSGTHLTYRLQRSELTEAEIAQGKKPIYFVKLLTGSDNENDYTYIGIIAPDRYKNNALAFRTTGKSKLTMDSKPCMVLARAFEFFVSGKMPFGLEVWHEGRCGRCGRKLTTPESVERGFGPDCIQLMGGLAALMTFAVPAPEHSVTAWQDVPRDPQASAVKVTKPVLNTPKAIVAAVNEDPEIARLAAEMWATNPANPANQKPVEPKAEPLPVDRKAAEALARSQNNWTVDDAVEALSRRRIISLDIKKSTKVADKAAALGVVTEEATEPQTDGVAETWKQIHEDLANWPEPEHQEPTNNDPAIIAMVNSLRDTDLEKFTMDGIMSETEAFNFWYRRFAASTTPVEG